MPPSKTSNKTTVEAQPIDPSVLAQNKLSTAFQQFLQPYRKSAIGSLFPEVTAALSGGATAGGGVGIPGDTSAENFDWEGYIREHPAVAGWGGKRFKDLPSRAWGHWQELGSQTPGWEFPSLTGGSFIPGSPESTIPTTNVKGIYGLDFASDDLAKAFSLLDELITVEPLTTEEKLKSDYASSFEKVALPSVINSLNAAGALRGGAVGEVVGKAGDRYALEAVNRALGYKQDAINQSRAAKQNLAGALTQMEAFKLAALNNQPFPALNLGPTGSTTTQSGSSGGGDMALSLLLPIIASAGAGFFGPLGQAAGKVISGMGTPSVPTSPGGSGGAWNSNRFSVSPGWETEFRGGSRLTTPLFGLGGVSGG